jgi:hypothetical protein
MNIHGRRMNPKQLIICVGIDVLRGPLMAMYI